MIALDYTACSRTNAGDICMVTCARGDYPRDGRASTCLCKGGAWVGQVSCTPCWAGLVSPGGSITVCTKCNTAFGRIPNAFKTACTSPPPAPGSAGLPAACKAAQCVNGCLAKVSGGYGGNTCHPAPAATAVKCAANIGATWCAKPAAGAGYGTPPPRGEWLRRADHPCRVHHQFLLERLPHREGRRAQLQHRREGRHQHPVPSALRHLVSCD